MVQFINKQKAITAASKVAEKAVRDDMANVEKGATILPKRMG